MPGNLEVVDPRERLFPASWKDAAIAISFDTALGGVICPGCGSRFGTRAELRRLHADHIVPYSLGGSTTWANLQILCADCNFSKICRA
jgi:5-methylcytosine-specific restriction endonuclease McrA